MGTSVAADPAMSTSSDEEDENYPQFASASGMASRITEAKKQLKRSLRATISEQHNYDPVLDIEPNLHKTVGVVSHAPHHEELQTKRIWNHQKQHPCSVNCMDIACWDPANHSMTIAKHPGLEKKDLLHHLRTLKRKPVKVYGPPDRPSSQPVEGWDYFDMSDESELEERHDYDSGEGLDQSGEHQQQDQETSEESDGRSQSKGSGHLRHMKAGHDAEEVDQDEETRDQYDGDDEGTEVDDEDTLARLKRGGHVNPRSWE